MREEEARALPGIDELVAEAKKYNLIGCDVFDEFTHEELVEQYNGVGPDRFPAIIRILLSGIVRPALPAVAIHDIKYYKGGSFAEFTASNKELKQNARILAKHKYKWYSLNRLRLYVAARLLQLFTDRYGLPGWNLH